MIIVLAIIMQHFSLATVNVYMREIIIGLLNMDGSVTGAVERIQGISYAIAATCEVPTMLYYTRLLRKFGVEKLMIFGCIGFTVKHALELLSVNEYMFYFAMIFQMFSYAVVIPGSVYVVDEYVSRKDRNKGQAFMGVTYAVGNILATLIGGHLLSVLHARPVLLICVLICLTGTIFMTIGIRSLKRPTEA